MANRNYYSALIAACCMVFASWAGASDGYFSVDAKQSAVDYVHINYIRMSEDGYLEVRTQKNGEPGILIGRETVRAGATRPHKVVFDLPTNQGVFVSLFANDGTLLERKQVTIKWKPLKM